MNVNAAESVSHAHRHPPSLARFSIESSGRQWKDGVSTYTLQGKLGGQPAVITWNERRPELTVTVEQPGKPLFTRKLTKHELQELAPKLDAFLQKTHGDMNAGLLMIGVNEAIYPPPHFDKFTPRSVFDVDTSIIMTGLTHDKTNGNADVYLDKSTGKLSVIYQAKAGNGARQRPMTRGEQTELREGLEKWIKKNPKSDPLIRAIYTASARY